MVARICLMMALVLFMISCKSDTSQEKSESSIVKNLTVEESEKLIQERPDIIILDVRTPQEWREGSLPNTVNIDVKADDFTDKVNKLDKNKTYLVHCRSGKRSTKAVGIMEKNGFKDIFHMDGGYLAWKKK